MRAVPSRAQYLSGWSQLHGGYDPARSRWVSGWLTLTYAAARPLAGVGVGPDAVTLLGPVVAVLAVLAVGSGRSPSALVGAAALVVVSALLDGLDGAVAVLTGRSSLFGAVLDSVADRLAEVAYLVVLARVGADVPLLVAAGTASLLAEYVRARAGMVGMHEVGIVTVGERPTRVVVTVMGLLAAAVVGHPADWAQAAAWAWLLTAVVAVVQLLVVVRRRLGRGAAG